MGLYDLDPKSGAQYAEQSAIAYRASLEELTLEGEPLKWAEAKEGLGNALEELGYKNSDSTYLNQAIDAYNDSLKVYKSDQQPLQWATANMSSARPSFTLVSKDQVFKVPPARRTELSRSARGVAGGQSARPAQ